MEDLSSENVLNIFFINKETESSREGKKCTSSLQNVSIACLFTRPEYSTSRIGIRNKSLKTLTETESLNFLTNGHSRNFQNILVKMMMKTYELTSKVPDPVIFKLMNENGAEKFF